MNEKLLYNGVVTLIHKVGNRVTSKKYYNNGTNRLFEAYARALCGQSINNFTPKYVDIGKMETIGITNTETQFSSVIKDNIDIPVFTTYKDVDIDGGEYGVPYCRVNIMLSHNMFNSEVLEGTTTLTLKLKSSTDDESVLATTEVANLSSDIISATNGTQLIVLWDLYINNVKE
jgi:hypothetical protein